MGLWYLKLKHYNYYTYYQTSSCRDIRGPLFLIIMFFILHSLLLMHIIITCSRTYSSLCFYFFFQAPFVYPWTICAPTTGKVTWRCRPLIGGRPKNTASTAALAKWAAPASATRQRWRGNLLPWQVHRLTTKTTLSTAEKAARGPV